MQNLKECNHLGNNYLQWLALSPAPLYCERDLRAIISCLACRECIPSGALTLDIALGGGFPKGRIIEVGSPTCNPLMSMIMLSCLVGHLIVCTRVLPLLQSS